MVDQKDPTLEKPLKQMLKEFYELRTKILNNDKRSEKQLSQYENLKQLLLTILEQKEIEFKEEIERNKIKKTLLVQRLSFFESKDDQKMQDELIKQIEEYTRIRRFRYAQLANIQRNILDVSQSIDPYSRLKKHH